jgi:hypothetical protein
MGLLQPYVGTYCSAESASSKLDIGAINAGCDAVDGEAQSMSNYVRSLSDMSSYLNEDTLSFNGVTMQQPIGDCCDGITVVQSNITGTTAQIRAAAENAYNIIQQQLNDEALERDRNEWYRRNGG